MTTLQSGAQIDTRPDEAKKKDFLFEEVVTAAGPFVWEEKPPAQWRRFPIFDQNGSGSCVAQTEAKELGIMRQQKDGVYVHFSATHIYQRRANKPQAGMGANDAREILRREGATLEVLTPSQLLTDEQMDGAIVEPYKKAVGEIFKVPNYLALPVKDIDVIASTIKNTGKGVMVWFYFKGNEWTDTPSIIHENLDLNAPDTIRHSVCAVDYTLVGGQKFLIIEDSWGVNAGTAGRRMISESFFKTRNWYAGYLINFVFDNPPPQKPHHVFNVDLEFGMQNDEVKALQDCLRYEGTFPSNAQSTGYFGAVTKKAVQGFQTAHAITTPDDPYFGRVGPKTRLKLNTIYGS